MGAKEDWLLSGRPIVVGDDYNAVTQYWFGAFAGFRDGEQPYHDVVAAEESFWNELLTDSPWPYIPDVMDGWDPRPWNEDVLGHLWWFLRTPAEVGAFTRDAIAWARTHAEANVEPRSQQPMIVVESWNEFGEGAQILPTVDEGYTYGQALAKALGIRWTPARFRVDIRVAGRGRVTSSPRGIACPGKCGSTSADGSTVTLHALPARGATFSGWSGACAGQARTCRISVTTDLVARARFTG
jgi:Divergent InlB B-repeat domain